MARSTRFGSAARAAGFGGGSHWIVIVFLSSLSGCREQRSADVEPTRPSVTDLPGDRTPAKHEPVAPTAGSPEGPLVIIGGRLDPDNRPIYEAIWTRRGGAGGICVVPTASAEPAKSMSDYVGDFERFFGPDAAIGLSVFDGDLAAAGSQELASLASGCGGFFFTGGDQSRIVDTFFSVDASGTRRPSVVMAAILERHRSGAVVAGTSAGAAMMSDPMIGGGSSRDALARGVCDRDGCAGVWLRRGVGLLPGWITDQHFVERGRVGRLVVAMLEDPVRPRMGLGVGENTAVVLDGDRASVVGSSGVVRLDPRAATYEAERGSWSGLTLDYFSDGMHFGLLTPTPIPSIPTPAEPLGATRSGAEDAFESTALFDSLWEAEVEPCRGVTWSGEGWTLTFEPLACSTPGREDRSSTPRSFVVSLEAERELR